MTCFWSMTLSAWSLRYASFSNLELCDPSKSLLQILLNGFARVSFDTSITCCSFVKFCNNRCTTYAALFFPLQVMDNMLSKTHALLQERRKNVKFSHSYIKHILGEICEASEWRSERELRHIERACNYTSVLLRHRFCMKFSAWHC